jgi:hypothetical protein
MADRRSKLEERKGNRVSTLETQRDEREAKLAGNRSGADEKRNALYGQLEARIETDEQKAAVKAFKKVIEAAVEKRRDAVDVAISEFRTGVDAAVAGRKDDMDRRTAAFQSAVEAALAQAKSDCTASANPEIVRTHFKESLAAARTALQNDRKESEKVGAQVKALAETRRIAVQKALDEFKATVEAARIELKKSFGEKADTEASVAP